jgi:glycogen debranching enzyme
MYGLQNEICKIFVCAQGPEWLWPLGYYLRARLFFPPSVAGASLAPADARIMQRQRQFALLSRLWRHRQHIFTSPYMALPELTNENGVYNLKGCFFLDCSSGAYHNLCI